MSEVGFVRLQDDADRALNKARDLSKASGHAYKLGGQSYGVPVASNFAILLAATSTSPPVFLRKR